MELVDITMKKRAINKFVSITVVTIIFVYAIFVVINRQNSDIQIYEKGHFCLAWIQNKMVTRSNSHYVTYEFNISGSVYKYERLVSENFYRSYNRGDTILVKVLSTDLPQSKIIENVSYKSCMKRQPSLGWEQLPVCK